MRYARYLALVMFGVSFALPALRPDHDSYTGWECLQFCMRIFSEPGARGAWRFYHFGFTVTNALFCVLWLVRVFRPQKNWIVTGFSLLALAHVASFFVLNVADMERQGKLLVRYGYYVWLGAFLLLALDCVKFGAPKVPNREPGPASGLASDHRSP